MGLHMSSLKDFTAHDFQSVEKGTGGKTWGKKFEKKERQAKGRKHKGRKEDSRNRARKEGKEERNEHC